MEYLQKKPRGQLTLYTTCLDDMVGYDNTVRAIGSSVLAISCFYVSAIR